MTITINIPDYLTAELASVPSDEIEDIAINALKVRYAATSNYDTTKKLFPPPGFAVDNRLAREASGDFCTVAEIIRKVRDYTDNRLAACALRLA